MSLNKMELLTLLQRDFPLISKPFSVLAESLAISERDLLAKIEKILSEQRIVRIGPVFDSKRLGYKSTLLAAKVSQEKLEQVVPVINHLRSVTHNYLREDEYNLWFVLIAPSELVLNKTIAELKERTKIRKFLNLKPKKRFKINTSFASIQKINEIRKTSPDLRLAEEDRRLINKLTYSIPLVSAPFKRIGEGLGLEEEEVLDKISNWLKQGIIRRFSAVVNPAKIGFEGSALGVWKVEKEEVNKVGRLMAEFTEVSHCYQRITCPEWGYNFYTMLHGKDRKDCQRIAEKLSLESGVTEFKLLFTLRELKKETIHYFEEEGEKEK